MFTILLVVQILVSIAIISLVMLQRGKGADMGAAFGSGASGTVFGARGSGSFFSRATAVLAAVFFINCILIASPLVRKAATGEPQSLADQIEQQAVEQQAVEPQPMAEALEPASEDVPAMTDSPEATGDLPAAEDLPEAGDAAPAGAADDQPQ
jgi:preprotein translocase subunit SecG